MALRLGRREFRYIAMKAAAERGRKGSLRHVLAWNKF